MRITYAPRGILQIDDARITYRNFEGRDGTYNRKGDRNFAVIIPNEDLANDLADRGWNIKIKPPREDGDSPFMYLPVKIKFSEYGPNVYLRTGKSQTRLDEESVSCLDRIKIVSVDMDIRPYDWNVNGKTGRTAWLQSICVTQDLDRFAERFADEEYPEE